MKQHFILIFIIIILGSISPSALSAEDLSLSALTLTTNADGSQEYSVTLQILILKVKFDRL